LFSYILWKETSLFQEITMSELTLAEQSINERSSQLQRRKINPLTLIVLTNILILSTLSNNYLYDTYRNKWSELPEEMKYIVYNSPGNSESLKTYIPIIREIPIDRNQLNRLFVKLRIIEKVRFQLIGKIRTLENI